MSLLIIRDFDKKRTKLVLICPCFVLTSIQLNRIYVQTELLVILLSFSYRLEKIVSVLISALTVLCFNRPINSTFFIFRNHLQFVKVCQDFTMFGRK